MVAAVFAVVDQIQQEPGGENAVTQNLENVGGIVSNVGGGDPNSYVPEGLDLATLQAQADQLILAIQNQDIQSVQSILGFLVGADDLTTQLEDLIMQIVDSTQGDLLSITGEETSEPPVAPQLDSSNDLSFQNIAADVVATEFYTLDLLEWGLDNSKLLLPSEQETQNTLELVFGAPSLAQAYLDSLELPVPVDPTPPDLSPEAITEAVNTITGGQEDLLGRLETMLASEVAFLTVYAQESSGQAGAYIGSYAESYQSQILGLPEAIA